MFNFLIWLLTIEVIGLATFPLCFFLFPKLKDRGYCVSKIFGLIILGYLSWILSTLSIVPSVQITLLLLLILMAVVSSVYSWSCRYELVRFLRQERFTILMSELTFLVVLVIWTIYRSYDPSINHTEQPMDFAFLNASIRNFLGQPEDPWFRGESISYYYFGYWIVGVLSELTAIPSKISYNLAMALIPALTSAGIFGLVYAMVRSETKLPIYAALAAITSSILIIFAANLEGVLEFMRINQMGSVGFWHWLGVTGLDGPSVQAAESWRPTDHWWWWKATRVISTFDVNTQLDYTIHEFPLFSFMLGDMHPHVISLPLVVLFTVACWNFFQTPINSWTKFELRPSFELLTLSLILACSSFTNMWDLPVLAAILLGTSAVKSYMSKGGDILTIARDSIPATGVVVGIAAILILPYLLSFTSQVSGINPVGSYSGGEIKTTRPIHTFIVWGLLLTAAVPFVIIEFCKTTVNSDWIRITKISLTITITPFIVWLILHLNHGGESSAVMGRLLHIFPYLLLILMCVYTLLWLVRLTSPPMGRAFCLIITCVGILLIMGPELLYVNDSFGGASERMNTVFKLYYKGWLLLCISSGFAVYYYAKLKTQLTGWKRFFSNAWAMAFIVLLLGSLYYSIAAPVSKGELFHKNPSLDGLAFIGINSPEYRSIAFLNKHANRDSGLLEAVDESSYYTKGQFGRVSASTGVPTVLGWPGHESQWRNSAGSYVGRQKDVERIYSTLDVEEAKQLLSKYDLTYVYIGPLERKAYGEKGLQKFSTFMELQFHEGTVSIYKWMR